MTAQHMMPLAEAGELFDTCPFYDTSRGYCGAALLRFIPDSRQLYHYCSCDDHDACPVFLAKALRSSSASGFARDAAACCEK